MRAPVFKNQRVILLEKQFGPRNVGITPFSKNTIINSAQRKYLRYKSRQ